MKLAEIKKLKIYSLLFIFFLFTLFFSCINLNKCKLDSSKRYYCFNDIKAINYLEFGKNGTFKHYYRKGNTELSHIGRWRENDEGYCYIELNEWKNFNEEGENYQEFGNGILYINGNFLNMSPDGESSYSYKKSD